MRRILPLLLCALIATPLYAHAEEEDTQTPLKAPKKKKKKVVKKHAAPAPKGDSRAEDLNSAPKKPEAPEPAKVAVVATEETEEVEETEAPVSFKRHRYGYFLGGGFLVAGLAFAYSAQGEAKRAETILSAREASQALANARGSASTSNVMYGIGLATLVVALLFELLPEPLAEKASLTFHF